MNSTTMMAAFQTPMTRRRALQAIGGVGLLALSGGLRATAASASSTGFYRTTAALNLRAKPRLDAKILRVIPEGGLVSDLGVSNNGFRKVVYDGTRGYAYESYLVEADAGDEPFNDIGDAVTTSAVNFRASASLSGAILWVVDEGETVEISDLVTNGYRYVRVNGATGWIYDDYLSTDVETGPISFKTTANVNLRAKPSLSATVIMVVPKGKTVVDYDLVLSNGFRGVDYNGTVGWISADYLKQI